MTESTQTQNSTSSSSPWGPQATALQGAFDNANTAYGKASTATAPSNFTAGMTPEQLQTFQSMLGYSGANQGASGAVTNTGVNNLGTGSDAAAGALTRLGAFDPSATNNMDAVISGANKYVSGFDVPGAVSAAMRDATQEARDVTLPGMESAAAGSGNINSSRTGIAEGLVQRGLAEKSADLSATLRNNLFSAGAAQEGGILSGNNANTLQADTSGGYIGSNLAANGASEVGQGINDGTNLFSLAAAGGSGLQQNNQLGLTNDLQKYEANVSSPYDALNAYMNIIGNRSWGQNATGTQQTTSTPSALQTIGGIASIF